MHAHRGVPRTAVILTFVLDFSSPAARRGRCREGWHVLARAWLPRQQSTYGLRTAPRSRPTAKTHRRSGRRSHSPVSYPTSRPAFNVQSRKELLTPVLLHSQHSDTFSALVSFHLSSTLSLSFRSLISAFRQPGGHSPTRVLQTPFVPYERRWCPGVPSSRELLDCE